MPPLDSLPTDPTAPAPAAPAPVTGLIATPSEVAPTYDTAGQLVPVYEQGQFRGYERPPGWQQPAPSTGKPQVGTTAAGAPDTNADFDPAAAAGLVRQPDGSYRVTPAEVAHPQPGPTVGTAATGATAGAPFDPAVAAGLVKGPDGGYRRADVAASPPPTPTVETKLKPGQTGGYFANVGAGTTEAVSGMLGLPVDLTTRALNLLPQGFNAATGANVPTIQSPVFGSDWWNKVFGLVGANPENVVPQTEMQAVARGAARGLTGVALPGGVARLLPEMAGTAEAAREALAAGTAPTAAAGATVGAGFGQSLRDYVPAPYGDVADMLGQIAGGVGAGATEAMLRGAGKIGTGAYRSVVGLQNRGAPEAIINPATGQPFTETVTAPGAAATPITASPGVQVAAARRVAAAAGQSPADLAASVAAAPAGQVAGSVPTMGQATGNLGLLGFERQLRNQDYGRAAFIEREAQNDVARVAALRNAQPGDVANAAGNWFKSKLQALRLANESDLVGPRADLEDALEKAGVTGVQGDVQGAGARTRAIIEAVRQRTQEALRRAYAKIDPDGKLALDTSSVTEAAKRIKAEVGLGDELSPIEEKVFQAAIDKFDGVRKFSDLRSLQSTIAAKLRQVRRSIELGAESQPYRRLSQLNAAVQDAITDAAERAIEREQAAGVAPGSRIIDGLAEIDAEAGGGAGPGLAGESAGAGAPGAAGEGGAAPAGKAPAVPAGPGPAAGDRGVAPGTAAEASALSNLGVEKPRVPEDAFSFIRSKGGVQPSQHLTEDANKAVLSSAWGNRPGGKLVDPKGMSLNHLREALAEEGFLGGEAGKDEHAAAEFVNHVAAEHVAGRKVYRPEDEAAAEQYEAQRHAEQMRAHVEEGYRDQILDAENNLGMRLSDAEIDHAVRMMADDPRMHPEEALRQAVTSTEEHGLQTNAQLNAFGRPGMPLAEQEALPLQQPRSSTLEESFDPDSARAVQQTNRDYAIYKNTYRAGAVGEVTASGVQGFRIGDSAVPGRLFRRGPVGAEAADSLIKAMGGVKEAEGALGDYPAMVLRDMAMKSGVFDPKGYQRFLNRYGPALAKFPGLAGRFRTIAEAQRQVEAAAQRGEARIEDFENSAASHYLGKEGEARDPLKAIGRLLNSDNVGQAFRDVMARAADNKAAVEGIRRNLLDHIIQKATSQAEAGTSGQKALAGAALQRTIADPKVAAAIREVLTPAQQRILQAVGDDMQLAARAYNAVKVPGSPTTAADLHALESHGRFSHFAQLFLGEQAGSIAAGVLGLHAFTNPILHALFEAAGMVTTETLSARRAAAVDNVNRLATEMVLNPELGRVLLERAALKPGSPLIARLRQKIIALTTGFGITSQRTH